MWRTGTMTFKNDRLNLSGTTTINKRASNFELLRIICMFLVMVVHYVPKRPEVTALTLNQDLLTSIVTLELKSLSFVCVHCFILISGFWGIKFRGKSFANLMFQILFWAVIGILMAKVLIPPYLHDSRSISEIIHGLLVWQQGRWFISAYIFLFMFSPVLNSFIEKSDTSTLGKYLLIFYLFSTIYGWCWRSEEFNTGLSAVSLFGLYLIGAYLRKCNASYVTWNKYYDLWGYLLTGFFLVAISIVLIRIGVTKSIYGYLNPLVILESIFLFQFFRKLNLQYNGLVNWLAASAFAVFLFHCDYCMSKGYDYYLRLLEYKFEYPLFPVLLYMVVVFLLVVVLDQLRIQSFNFISRWFNEKNK